MKHKLGLITMHYFIYHNKKKVYLCNQAFYADMKKATRDTDYVTCKNCLVKLSPEHLPKKLRRIRRVGYMILNWGMRFEGGFLIHDRITKRKRPLFGRQPKIKVEIIIKEMR